MCRCRDPTMPDEKGNGSDGPCSTSSSTTRPKSTCSSSLTKVRLRNPSGELVGSLDLPGHGPIMPKRNYATRVIVSRGSAVPLIVGYPPKSPHWTDAL